MFDAMQKWEQHIPEQIDEIFDSGKVNCIQGNMDHEDFGLNPRDIELLRREVTVVVHAAANISLAQSLMESIESDTMPVLRLAKIAESFSNLDRFVHISSTFAQMHLPSGIVKEALAKVEKDEPPPQEQLSSILATGSSPYTCRFITPYGHGKYLAERLLLEYQSKFPVLIIRPSAISPALQEPYPLYGPDAAIPLHTLLAITIYRGFDFWEAIDVLPHDYIFDEIPVDIVGNVSLLHMASGTTGIVHAAAQLHVPLTVRDYAQRGRKYISKEAVERLGARGRLDSKPRQLPLEFHRLLTESWRDWTFDCERSRHLLQTTGPIGLNIPHDFEALLQKRSARLSKTLVGV
ncbi:hypothetical protein NLG97_g3748 [Lecanicillium saksenae]|uniref:Uncharacterized protein n=1 Tax=Lecanicillium saksenae TaxID=468837 RepID=A0ACC1R0G4_9HYPO|nr:hypothetical protein NLG97_g3748 [Lecanicillium saksenae]